MDPESASSHLLQHRAVRAVALMLLPLLFTACTSAPTFQIHPDFSQRKETLKRVGLVPPNVVMLEEEARYRTVPHPDWSAVSAERLTEAFSAEAQARQLPLTVLDPRDPKAAALADLFAPLDLSIGAHVYQRGGGHISDEPLPGAPRPFIYNVGPLHDLLAADNLDGVWLIDATNLVPTAAARRGDSALIALSLVSDLALHPVPAMILDKITLHAALFDKEGVLLFHCIVDDVRLPPAATAPDPAGEFDSRPVESGAGPVDLRDERYARAAVKAILSLYRQGLNR